MNPLKMLGSWGPFEAWLYTHVVAGGLGPLYQRFVDEAVPPLDPGASVVDVGCGDGQLAQQIALARPETRVTGLDLAPSMIDRAASRYRNIANLNFLVADAAELPFDDQSIDFVVSLASIKHWPDQKRGLAEMWRVLKVGGTIGVLEANRECSAHEANELVSRWRYVLPGTTRLVAMYFRHFVAGQGLSLARLTELAQAAGWQNAEGQKVPDLPIVAVQARREAGQ